MIHTVLPPPPWVTPPRCVCILQWASSTHVTYLTHAVEGGEERTKAICKPGATCCRFTPSRSQRREGYHDVLALWLQGYRTCRIQWRNRDLRKNVTDISSTVTHVTASKLRTERGTSSVSGLCWFQIESCRYMYLASKNFLASRRLADMIQTRTNASQRPAACHQPKKVKPIK